MAQKYKYQEVVYVKNWSTVWRGVFLACVNGLALMALAKMGNTNVIVEVVAIVGLAAAVAHIPAALDTKKKRVPLSSKDDLKAMKEDLKNG